MGLEVFNFVDSLVITNPVGATDQKQQGDDHIRGVKTVIVNSFPNFTGAMTLTHLQLNDAAQLSVANVFTVGQRIEALSPLLFFFDTDAAADNGKWRVNAASELFRVQLVDDAETGTVTAIEIQRTANVIDSIELDALQIILDGVVRVIDAGGTDFVDFEQDGTDLTIAATLTDNIRISGLTGGLLLEDSASINVFDSTNTDFVGIRHDDTDGVFDFFQCLDVEFGRDNPPTGQYRFTNNASADTQLILTDNGTDVAFVQSTAAAGARLRSLVHGAPVVLDGEDGGGTPQTILTGDPDGAAQVMYNGTARLATQDVTATGNTTGATVDDSAGVARDVGFNVLPIFNINTSDTLEKAHCGFRNRLGGANNATLTLPEAADLDFPVNGVTYLEVDTGTYTIAEGSDTTLSVRVPGTGLVDSTGGATVEAGGFATIMRVSAAGFEIFGSEIVFTP